MAYTRVWSVITPAGSDPLNTADDEIRNLRVDVQDRLNDLVDDFTVDPVVVKNSLSRVKVVLTSNLLIANNVVNNITWDTEVYDFGAMFTSPSINLVIPITGEYLISAYIEYAANIAGVRGIGIITPNAAREDIDLRIDAAAAGTTGLSISMPFSLTATDNVTVFAFQTSGGNLNILANRCGASAFRIYGS